VERTRVGVMSFESVLISSYQNPKVKLISNLSDRRDREKLQLFLIEGYREVYRACLSHQKIKMVFFCPELFLGSNEMQILEKCKMMNIEIYRCTEKIFRSFSYRDRPDGLLAVAEQHHLRLSDLHYRAGSLYIIAEAIEKPGNLGTILRSSDAVGADAVIICDRCTDIHNPNVVRSSVGTLFTLPVIEATSSETLAWMKEKSVRILAATPHATIEYTKINMKDSIAIVVGTEQYGLSPQWMESADTQVKIPMRGFADSLNVAMATTVLMYEALRQRS
jgi:TrmH family RNA methyltransferase